MPNAPIRPIASQKQLENMRKMPVRLFELRRVLCNCIFRAEVIESVLHAEQITGAVVDYCYHGFLRSVKICFIILLR